MAMVVLAQALEPDTACVLCSLYYHVNESLQQRFSETRAPLFMRPLLPNGWGGKHQTLKLFMTLSPLPLGSV